LEDGFDVAEAKYVLFGGVVGRLRELRLKELRFDELEFRSEDGLWCHKVSTFLSKLHLKGHWPVFDLVEQCLD
jgi:hypothetical protein